MSPDDDVNQDHVDRTTIITRFSRVANDNSNSGEGLDEMIWDPRGTVKHNGVGSMAIELVQRVLVQSLSENSISTSAACFETEPKEDVGLDIYYEVTGGIPTRLNENNIIQYTGANQIEERAAKFSVGNRKVTGVTNNEVVNLTGDPYVYSTGITAVNIHRRVNGVLQALKTIIDNKQSQKSVESFPSWDTSLQSLITVLINNEKIDEAGEALKRFLSVDKTAFLSKFQKNFRISNQSLMEKMVESLPKVGLPEN